MKRLLGLICIGGLGLTLAAPAMAGDGFICDRTRLSTTGFTTRSAAENWYPQELWFEIDGDRVTRSYFGEGRVEPDGKRLLLSFNLGSGFSMGIRLFPDLRATAAGSSGPRFESVSPSRYQCQRVNLP